MKLAVFAFSRRGRDTARRCLAALAGPGDEYRGLCLGELGGRGLLPHPPAPGGLHRPGVRLGGRHGVRGGLRHRRPGHRPPTSGTRGRTRRCWRWMSWGQFVIPLLSGHIGGANRLAAPSGGGRGRHGGGDHRHRREPPVLRGRVERPPGPLYRRHGRRQGGLRRHPGGACPCVERLPHRRGPCPPVWSPGRAVPWGSVSPGGGSSPLTGRCCWCRRCCGWGSAAAAGPTAGAIAALVDQLFAEHNVHPAAVGAVATIDLKKRRDRTAGLLPGPGAGPCPATARRSWRRWRGTSPPSDFVRSVTGVDNVCERAALLGAERLLVKKTARDGVTAALALNAWEVRFG